MLLYSMASCCFNNRYSLNVMCVWLQDVPAVKQRVNHTGHWVCTAMCSERTLSPGRGTGSALGEWKILLTFKFPRLGSWLTIVWRGRAGRTCGGCHLISAHPVGELLMSWDPVPPSKLIRDSGRLCNEEQWEVAYRYFPGFSFSSAIESCKEDHKPCHHECGGTVHRPGRADRLSCQSPSCWN